MTKTARVAKAHRWGDCGCARARGRWRKPVDVITSLAEESARRKWQLSRRARPATAAPLLAVRHAAHPEAPSSGTMRFSLPLHAKILALHEVGLSD